MGLSQSISEAKHYNMVIERQILTTPDIRIGLIRNLGHASKNYYKNNGMKIENDTFLLRYFQKDEDKLYYHFENVENSNDEVTLQLSKQDANIQLDITRGTVNSHIMPPTLVKHFKDIGGSPFDAIYQITSHS